METTLLITASFATLLLVGAVFFAAVLLRRWRREVGREGGGVRERMSLEALYAQVMAQRGAGAADPAVQARATAEREEAHAQLADAEGLLERLRREGGAEGGELAQTVVEAKAEIQKIRACLNRGAWGEGRELAQALTLRLAARIARLGRAG